MGKLISELQFVKLKNPKYQQLIDEKGRLTKVVRKNSDKLKKAKKN